MRCERLIAASAADLPQRLREASDSGRSAPPACALASAICVVGQFAELARVAEGIFSTLNADCDRVASRMTSTKKRIEAAHSALRQAQKGRSLRPHSDHPPSIRRLSAVRVYGSAAGGVQRLTFVQCRGGEQYEEHWGGGRTEPEVLHVTLSTDEPGGEAATLVAVRCSAAADGRLWAVQLVSRTGAGTAETVWCGDPKRGSVFELAAQQGCAIVALTGDRADAAPCVRPAAAVQQLLQYPFAEQLLAPHTLPDGMAAALALARPPPLLSRLDQFVGGPAEPSKLSAPLRAAALRHAHQPHGCSDLYSNPSAVRSLFTAGALEGREKAPKREDTRSRRQTTSPVPGRRHRRRSVRVSRRVNVQSSGNTASHPEGVEGRDEHRFVDPCEASVGAPSEGTRPQEPPQKCRRRRQPPPSPRWPPLQSP
eukprot:TRINITY_DN8228_c0_g1_i2.p1 TRINITY_DN8228_c0_g1~~TRINITY_DN8228_c0_g1_i2.p1  ORF type:complete len:425 (+),score=40.43 TRINITY_DN8228_c0_g1_i2:89-1363(+)